MDDLIHTLHPLCQRNHDGSHATQTDRQRSLTLVARQLRETGFRQMRATLRNDIARPITVGCGMKSDGPGML
jgi:hypothetical protein